MGAGPLPKRCITWLQGSSPSCLSFYIALLRGDHNDLRGAGLRLAGHDKCISHLWSYGRKCIYIYIIFLRHGIYINDMYYYVCMVCNLSLMSDINVYNEI